MTDPTRSSAVAATETEASDPESTPDSVEQSGGDSDVRPAEEKNAAALAGPTAASAASMSEIRKGDHRSWVRPVVTYSAAFYLFLLVPGFILWLVVARDIVGTDKAILDGIQAMRELLLLPVPLAGTIISYWFATRSSDKRHDVQNNGAGE